MAGRRFRGPPPHVDPTPPHVGREAAGGLWPHARHTFLRVSAAFLKLQSPGSVRFGVPCGSAGRGTRHAEGAQRCTVNFRRSRVWRCGSPPRPLNSVPLPRLFSLLLRSPEKAESVRIVGDPSDPGVWAPLAEPLRVLLLGAGRRLWRPGDGHPRAPRVWGPLDPARSLGPGPPSLRNSGTCSRSHFIAFRAEGHHHGTFFPPFKRHFETCAASETWLSGQKALPSLSAG